MIDRKLLRSWLEYLNKPNPTKNKLFLLFAKVFDQYEYVNILIYIYNFLL